MTDKTTRVYPSSKLTELEYVPGVGADGADLPTDEAEVLLDAGLVVKNKPKSDAPAEPAKPEDN
jgi:hypothetical protein